MAKETKPFVFYSDDLSYKSVTTKDGKKYFVEGYISTGDIDLVNDIVTEKGMTDMAKQLKERNIKLDFEHEAFRGDTVLESEINKTRLPLGRITDYQQDNKGLKVQAELNPAWKKLDKDGNVTRTFNDIWSSIKGQFLDAFSIAYIPVRTAVKQMKDGSQARLLDGLNLLNVAITGNPVNPTATMTNVMAKSLDFMKDKEGETMTEEKSEVKEELKEEEKKAEEVPEVKEEPEAEPEAEPEPEEKAEEVKSEFEEELVEVKSRLEETKTELKELRNENKELKEIVEKARHKTVKEQRPKKSESKATEGPLDFIR